MDFDIAVNLSKIVTSNDFANALHTKSVCHLCYDGCENTREIFYWAIFVANNAKRPKTLNNGNTRNLERRSFRLRGNLG